MKRKIALLVLAIVIIIVLIIIWINISGEKLPQTEHLDTNEIKEENVIDNFIETNIVTNETDVKENVESQDDSNIVENTNGDSSSSSLNSENSSSSNSSNNSGSSDSTSQESKPTHTHSWKDHTSQRWVDKWVTVVDTPAQTIQGAQLYTKHSDGDWYGDGKVYWFENGFTHDDFKEILKDKIKNEGYIGNYVNRSKTVPAVTHEENQGYYETYVDYQYCECGATK